MKTATIKNKASRTGGAKRRRHRITKKSPVRHKLEKRRTRGSTGSIAPNLHEGSRSEYLAQYMFSAFGTAVPVPHQEDTGLDIYCTLLEPAGRRAWPRAHYSVQVKSTMDPWIFDGAESVRWLIEHPLPIFLCIVNKAEARLLIYHTTPRFAAWILPLHKSRLELIPGTEREAQPVSWEHGSRFELRAPILSFTIQEALDDSFRQKIATVLKWWIDFDMENIFRIKCGNHHFRVPYQYKTNHADIVGGMTEFGGPFSEPSITRANAVVTELIGRLATHCFRHDRLASAAIYAAVLRQLAPTSVQGEFTPHDYSLHTTLNNRFEMSPPTYQYQAVDSLRQLLVDRLADRGITDAC